MLKIIAGEFRSRKLLTPEDDSISRPYAGRVKESVFNLLRGWFEGATVIDLFAGVGTVGLEAVSRGATNVFMVERNRDILHILQKNIDLLRCSDRATAVQADALGPAVLTRGPRPVDIIFVDPPYELMRNDVGRMQVLNQIARLRSMMKGRGFVVLRSPISAQDAEFAIPGYAGPEQHNYGQEMFVMLYAPAPIAWTEGSATAAPDAGDEPSEPAHE
jgi:16S rRNA (guanine966-N2)-methyltransferase